MAREKEAYEAARFVVCMSRWCAEDVKASYGISPEKVRVVLPGANIDEASVPAPADGTADLAPLRLGFIGIDWERKGGPAPPGRGNEAAEDGALGRGRRHRSGCVQSFRRILPLRAMGFIDKARDLPRFVEVVRSFHFGCLLSHAEALGYLHARVPAAGRSRDRDGRGRNRRHRARGRGSPRAGRADKRAPR